MIGGRSDRALFVKSAKNLVMIKYLKYRVESEILTLEELPRLEEESDFVKCSSLEQRLAREQIWNSPETACMEVGRKDEVASWRVEDRGASSQARMAAFAGNVGDLRSFYS